jgi:excisionase family DNA binding protein
VSHREEVAPFQTSLFLHRNPVKASKERTFEFNGRVGRSRNDCPRRCSICECGPEEVTPEQDLRRQWRQAKKVGTKNSPAGPKGNGRQWVLTVEQLAERFQLSPKTVYRALERREIRAAKLGNRWRIRIEDAERWFDEHVPQGAVPVPNAHTRSTMISDESLRPLLVSDKEKVT